MSHVVTSTTTGAGGGACAGALRAHFLSQQGSLRRIGSLGALGEGSGWDLRIRPAAQAAAAPAPPAAAPGPKWVGPRGAHP